MVKKEIVKLRKLLRELGNCKETYFIVNEKIGTSCCTRVEIKLYEILYLFYMFVYITHIFSLSFCSFNGSLLLGLWRIW